MNYEALRAVFRRVNVLLGANCSMHDLRTPPRCEWKCAELRLMHHSTGLVIGIW